MGSTLVTIIYTFHVLASIIKFTQYFFFNNSKDQFTILILIYLFFLQFTTPMWGLQDFYFISQLMSFFYFFNNSEDQFTILTLIYQFTFNLLLLCVVRKILFHFTPNANLQVLYNFSKFYFFFIILNINLALQHLFTQFSFNLLLLYVVYKIFVSLQKDMQ